MQSNQWSLFQHYKSNSIKLQIQHLINRFQKQRTYLTIVLPQYGSTHIIHIHTVSVLTVYICTVVGSEHPSGAAGTYVNLLQVRYVLNVAPHDQFALVLLLV